MANESEHQLPRTDETDDSSKLAAPEQQETLGHSVSKDQMEDEQAQDPPTAPTTTSTSESISQEQAAVEGTAPATIQAKLPLPAKSAGETSRTVNKKPPRPSGTTSTVQGNRISFVLGDSLEYRVARLYMYQGYYVRRGRVIYTIGRLDQATDLDVLALRFNGLFRKEVTIAECKSGGEGPLDRVFWLAGVKRFVRADQAFLVRRPTKWNIKDFAKEASIEILDTGRLEELETMYGISPDQWPGFADPNFFRSNIPDWNEVLRQDRYLSEMYISFAGETKFDEPFSGVNFLIHHLRTLVKESRTPYRVRRSLITYLITEAVSQLAVFIMQICGKTMDLASSDRRGLITKRLTHGELDADLAQRVFTHAYQLARQAASHYVNAPVEIDRSLFTVPSPDYVRPFADFVEFILTNAPISGTLVPMTDLILAESFVKQNAIPSWLKQFFSYPDFHGRTNLVRSYVKFLRDLECLPSEALGSFGA